MADAQQWCTEQSRETSWLFVFYSAVVEENMILPTELTEYVNRKCMCMRVGIWPQRTISWKYSSSHN